MTEVIRGVKRGVEAVTKPVYDRGGVEEGSIQGDGGFGVRGSLAWGTPIDKFSFQD